MVQPVINNMMLWDAACSGSAQLPGSICSVKPATLQSEHLLLFIIIQI